MSRYFVRVAACLLAGAAIATGAVAHEYKTGTVEVSHPWARATPGGAKVGAAYLMIKAAQGGADKLIGGRADIAGRVELHSHVHEAGVMRMRRVDFVSIPAGGEVVFRPSGYHIMLMDLKKPLKEGDLLPLTLVFEKSGEVTVEATVEPIGAKGPHGFDHQPDAPSRGASAKTKPKPHSH